MSKVKLWACGGAGLNIAKTLYVPEAIAEPGFASIETIFIDTSGSNVPKGILPESFIRIQDLDGSKIDGSGKVRDTNYKAAAAAVPQILHDHKPGDLNIVLHSAGGGSGGAAGPALVSELLHQGEDVVVIMVGSTTCRQEVKNTINTILSYQGVSSKRKKAVLSYYLENTKGNMAENDAMVSVIILLLAALWSGENHGLDSEDLHNWIHWDRVSTYPASLGGLSITANGKTPILPKGQAVSSTISLIREGEEPDPGLLVGYHSFGILSQPGSESIKMETPIHLHTVQGFFTSILNNLKDKLEEIDELHRSNSIAKIDLGDAEMEDDGLVL